MFKTSVITDEVSQDFSLAVDFAIRHKLNAVEIRSVEEKNPFQMTVQDIAKIKDTLCKTELEVCCISSPFFKCSLEEKAEIAAHIEGLKRCIDMAKSLNCKLIRGFTFWNKGNFQDKIDDILAEFSEPIRLLKSADIKLVLEFDPTVYATNAQKAAMLLDKLNSPFVKALWDPGNDIYDEDREIPFPNGYEIIKNHIAHIHLKDASLVDGKPKAMPIGKGQVDFLGQLKALKRDNYQGYMSLETHYRPAFSLSDEILKQPSGSAFSYLGMEASEECIANLYELFGKI